MAVRTFITNDTRCAFQLYSLYFLRTNSHNWPCQVKGYKHVWYFSVLLSVFCDPGKQQDTLSDKTRQGPDLALALFLKGEVRIGWNTQSNKEHSRQQFCEEGNGTVVLEKLGKMGGLF